MKKTFSFLIFLLFIFTINSSAQTGWFMVSDNPWSANSTIIFKDANSGAIGSTFRSLNGGVTWLEPVTPPPYYNPTHIAYLPGTNTLYGAGSNYTIVKSTDFGNHWYEVSVNWYVTSFLQFVDSQTGYAVGYNSGGLNNLVKRTNDGGDSWTTVTPNLPSNYNILNLCFLNGNTGYLVGCKSGTGEGIVCKTENSGSSWTINTSFPAYEYTRAIAFANANTGVVLGDDNFYRTINGGSTWQQVTRLTSYTMYNAVFVDQNTAFAVGGPKILKTEDAGQSWAVQYTGSASFVSICFINPYTGWAVGDYGGVFKTLDGGGLIAPPPPTLISPANNATGVPLTPTLDWSDVSTASSYNVQVSEYSGFSTTIVNESGLTSSQYTVPSGPLYQNDTYYWRVRATNSAGTGQWSSVFSFSTGMNAPSAPSLSSPSNGATGVALTPVLNWGDVYGANTYGVQVATDNGFYNVIIDQSGLTSSQYNVTGGLNNNTVYYWRANATNSGGTSAWSGAFYFTTVASAPGAPVLNIPPNNSVNVSTTPYLDWSNVSGAVTYAVQVSPNSGFTNLHLNTSGLTNSEYNVPMGYLLQNTLYYWRAKAINTGGAGPWSNVWIFTTGNIGIKNISNEIPSEFKLYNNYPNPFNPVTNIRFDIAKKENTQIIVYDLNGKEIETIVNNNLEPGQYVVDWNAANYPSGVYFYILKTDEYRVTKKMVLLK